MRCLIRFALEFAISPRHMANEYYSYLLEQFQRDPSDSEIWNQMEWVRLLCTKEFRVKMDAYLRAWKLSSDGAAGT